MNADIGSVFYAAIEFLSGALVFVGTMLLTFVAFMVFILVLPMTLTTAFAVGEDPRWSVRLVKLAVGLMVGLAAYGVLEWLDMIEYLFGGHPDWGEDIISIALFVPVAIFVYLSSRWALRFSQQLNNPIPIGRMERYIVWFWLTLFILIISIQVAFS